MTDPAFGGPVRRPRVRTEDIVSTAAALFARDGYHQVGMRAVADALGIALGRRVVEARPPAAPLPTAADSRSGALGREGLERVFEAVSLGLDVSGEGADRRFLARLALLLAEEVGDPERVLALVAAASDRAGA